MNRTAHVSALFSVAFDDELAPRKRIQFDQHLTSCPDCTAAFEEYRAAINAVRSMPQARMPVRVRVPDVLPASPRIGHRLRELLVGGRGAATALGLAGAAVLLVVATHASPSSPSTATALAPLGGSSTVSPRIAAAAPALSGGSSACTATLLAAVGSPPATYADSVTVGNSDPHGAHLTLAVSSATVKSGAIVSVWAGASVPLTTVSAPGTKAQPPVAVGPCIVVATPSHGADYWSSNSTALNVAGTVEGRQIIGVGGTGLAQVLIPAGLHVGDHVTIEAVVPAGAGQIVAVPALQASLTLTIGP